MLSFFRIEERDHTKVLQAGQVVSWHSSFTILYFISMQNLLLSHGIEKTEAFNKCFHFVLKNILNGEFLSDRKQSSSGTLFSA